MLGLKLNHVSKRGHRTHHTHNFISGVITHPCPKFNSSLTKPPLKLRYGSHLIVICDEISYSRPDPDSGLFYI